MTTKRQTVHLIYISPNGTTQKTVRNIAKGMGDVEVIEHNLLTPESRHQKYSFGNNDLVILGFATAGMLFGKVNKMFDCIEGNNTPLVGVIVYGNGYYGISLIQMKKKAENKGFRVSALAAFIGQHALASNIATNRPDEKDERIQADFGKAIYDKVIVNQDFNLPQKPKAGWAGVPSYNMVVAFRHFTLNGEYNLPLAFRKKEISEERCIKCKKCESNCPSRAIVVEKREFELKNCMGCYRCINNCPKNAITATNKMMNNICKNFSQTKAFHKRKEPTILI